MPGKYCNYECMQMVWKTIDPYKLPAQLRASTLPTVIPTPRELKKAFHVEWSFESPLSLMQHCHGNLCTYDAFIAGPRGNEDINRIKKGGDYLIESEEGYGRSKFYRGRAKSQVHREWWHHTVCFCKGGKHIEPKKGFHYLINKDGNPHRSQPPNWCTTCPLANWQFREMFKEARGRRYAKLNKATGAFTRYNEGDVVEVATDWMVSIGICPPDRRYSHNSGRKSLARLLSKYNISYELGFEVHGDKWCVWQGNYQPDCAFSQMERRDQHKNPDVCCSALRTIATGFGLGIIKAKPMSRLELFMFHIMNKQDPQLAEAIKNGTKRDDDSEDESEEDYSGPPPRPVSTPRRIPRAPAPPRKRPKPTVKDELDDEWRAPQPPKRPKPAVKNELDDEWYS